MGGLENPIHLIFLLALLLLVFGAKRLPEMGRSLGSGLGGFRDALGGEAPQQRVLDPRAAAVSESADARAPNAEAARGGEARPGAT
jgi:sec-independent protein translocase protein TatA